MGDKKVNLSVTLDVDDNLSWGELFRFVALARQAGVRPEDLLVVTPSKDGHGAVFLTLILPAEGTPDEG